MSKLILLFCLSVHFFSISTEIESILKQKREHVDRIEIIPSDNVTYISSEFADLEIKTIGLRDKLKQLEIIKIYYAYTAYKRSESFEQIKLDRNRFTQLKKLYPILFYQQNFKWEIIEQQGLKNHINSHEFFHGFIIVHRPIPTKKNRQKELDFVNQFLDHPEMIPSLKIEDPIAELIKKYESKTESLPLKNTKSSKYEGGDQALFDHIQMNLNTPKEVWKDRKDFWAKFSLIINKNGEVGEIKYKEEYSKSVKKAIKEVVNEMPNWLPKIVNSKPVTDTIKFEWRISYTPQLKGMYLIDGKPPVLNHSGSGIIEKISLVTKEKIETSPVYHSLNQIKLTNRMAVVMDVTGSMQNNTVSTCYWLKQNEDKLPFTSYTVFNDGDNMADDKKEIGNTKGIYFTSFQSEFNELIRTAMTNGNGGDYPENDIEAILYAIRKDINATEVLLIADNMSLVKDYTLLAKINKPVSILPCGLTGLILQQYLDIVFKTKGKIYYKDQTIDLSTLKRGDQFKINRVVYTNTGNRITPQVFKYNN